MSFDLTPTLPERKRKERPNSPQPKNPAIRLSTVDGNSVPSIEDETTDEAQSPRSAAAYRFKDLRIAGNGGVARPDWLSAAQLDGSLLDGNAARKRTKFVLDGVEEIPETPQISFATDLNFNRAAYARPDESPVGNRGDPIIFRGSDSHPTNSRTSGKRRSLRSRPPRNTRTPPPDVVNQQDLSPPPSSPLVPETPSSPEITSLHWDDSEITGHNPSDPEDDGEGINGLGFKPTAAIARSRSERRRKQMAEYKSREAREAREVRARRIQQRRREKAGELAAAAEQKDAAEKKRRVRFLEAEKAVGVL